MPDHVDRAAVLAGLEPFGSALVRAVDELDHASREAFAGSRFATAFTFFEACSINFAILV
jgi:hypothetical protein